jgi:exopolysaccharide production protein ExoY
MMGAAFLVPAVVIAIAVAIDSPGNIFYRERRVGRNGRTFKLWKFRSMKNPTSMKLGFEVEDPHMDEFRLRTVKHLAHPRVTRVGAFIRRWSLDEIPQLLNVLRGEMSLVGPRPVVASELPLYGNLVQFYLRSTPGLSGLWQVSGRSDLTFATRAILDAAYVSNWSFVADMKILALTLPAIISGTGAR